jgi:hypothetical protein
MGQRRLQTGSRKKIGLLDNVGRYLTLSSGLPFCTSFPEIIEEPVVNPDEMRESILRLFAEAAVGKEQTA